MHRNQGARWSDDDLRALPLLSEAGGSYRDAEQRFGRSRDAIRENIGILGLTLSRSPRN